MIEQAPLRRKDSGQLLIVAALAIAIMISSTTMYVFEASREPTDIGTQPINDFIFELKQCTRNAIVSSLANISNGGTQTELTSNLNNLSQTIRKARALGTCDLTYSIFNNSDYASGIRLTWNSGNIGTSSSYVNFRLQIDSTVSQISAEYATNITTSLALNGSYSTLINGDQNVSLACQVTNEGHPALIRNLAAFYYDAGNWTQVDVSNNLVLIDLGNGTYIASFTITATTDPVRISVHAVDLRNIFVSANATCNRT